MMVSIVHATKGHQSALMDNAINSVEKSKRQPRWTRQETLTLIQSKDLTENSLYKGRKISSSVPQSLSDISEPKWVMISSYCQQQGVNRGPAQCRKRWNNLTRDFNKVKYWEANLKNRTQSFWIMRNDLRKENKLPGSFDREVFKVLSARELDASTAAVSPMPLQAVSPFSGTYSAADCYGDCVANEDGLDEDEMAEDVDEDTESDAEANIEGEDKVLTDSKSEEREDRPLFVQNSHDIKTDYNVNENPAKTTPQPTSVQHHQAFQKQKNSKEGTATDAFRETTVSMSYWNSQERRKQRRLSTDESEANIGEAELIKMLEANNEIFSAQLDAHNKTIQLDREQRKENNGLLMTALSKLNDVLEKIAEKL